MSDSPREPQADSHVAAARTIGLSLVCAATILAIGWIIGLNGKQVDGVSAGGLFVLSFIAYGLLRLLLGYPVYMLFIAPFMDVRELLPQRKREQFAKAVHAGEPIQPQDPPAPDPGVEPEPEREPEQA